MQSYAHENQQLKLSTHVLWLGFYLEIETF